MAETKRLTRGIQLNQQISSDFPSFNLFITQEIADNVGSIAKMREERLSEHLQDPIGVQNLPQIQNGNVESSSTRRDLEKDDEDRIVVEGDGNEEHDQNQYNKNIEDIPGPMNFGVDLIDNKNWFYKLSSKGQLLSDSKAKYEVASSFKYTSVDCVFTSKISSIWGKYANLDSDVCCVDEEHIIGEYIRGYKVHAVIPWHLVDHIFVLVHVNDKFHWVLAVVSLNDKRINVYDSYRAAGHNAAIMCEVKKLAQLILLKLTVNDYYKNIGVDISLSQ
ncbi:hypothetical protein KY289_023436 [Solanum tuberosum]|nr:hypothetical protein KY289_023436 [Solanum tuberosum]